MSCAAPASRGPGRLATVLPDDAANVFITLSARSLNRGLTIIARGEAASTESKLIQAGADRVVLPTRIGAERMAELLLYQNVAKLLSGIQAGDLDRLGRDLRRLGLEIEVVAAEKGSRSVGATVGELEAIAAGAFLVVALDRRNGKTLLQPPAILRSTKATALRSSGGQAEPKSSSRFRATSCELSCRHAVTPRIVRARKLLREAIHAICTPSS